MIQYMQSAQNSAWHVADTQHLAEVDIILLSLKESDLYLHMDLALHLSVLFYKLCDFGLLTHPL